MHKDIKKFSMTGEAGDDAALPRLRTEFERMTLQTMRDNGYIPVLDLGPYWSTEYDVNFDKYKFVLSMYGVFVGRRKASTVEGISDGRELPRHTPPNKSSQSSTKSE